MEDSNTADLPNPPLLARVYGVRTLYQPTFRLLALRMAALLSCGLYVARALGQLASLPGASLEWDFQQFFQAAQALASGHDPYGSFLAHCSGAHWCQGGYIFPPLLAESMVPLTLLPIHTAAAAWLFLSHVFLVAAVVVTRRTIGSLIPEQVQLLLLVATLAFLPLYVSLYFLQVGTLLLLLLALAAAAHTRTAVRSGFAEGGWLGLASVLRVTPVLAFPALLTPLGGGRAARRAVVAFAAAGAATIALLAALTPYTVEYFTRVLPRIGSGTGILDNQSLPGFLERGLELTALPVPPTAVTGILITAAFLVPSFVVARRASALAPGPQVAAATFAIFLGAIPVVSSITWQHHLLTEMLVYALAVPLLLTTRGSARRAGRWLLVAAYPLLLADRHLTDPVALAMGLGQPTGWRILPFMIVTGMNLAGMICLWAGVTILLSAAGRHGLHDGGAGA